MTHPTPREDWLAQHHEAPLEPDLPIVDAHHHLWDREGYRYLQDAFQDDIAQSGHRIQATVYVQARASYRQEGPEPLRPVGETEFAARIAAMSDGATQFCAAIVGFADLTRGDLALPVLEAHLQAGNGRFRGIRQITTWDADARIMNAALCDAPRRLDDAGFRRGAAHLSRLGLSFDAWVFHPQLPDVMRLADALPDLTIILNHMGGPLHLHGYAGRRDDIRAVWLRDLRELARRPNVHVKLGGLGMRISGRDYASRPYPPTSQTLCDDWAPSVHGCIDAFGPERCMFESNFPVDKVSMRYGIFWNACKRITAAYTGDERRQLFSDTARRVYRLAQGA